MYKDLPIPTRVTLAASLPLRTKSSKELQTSLWSQTSLLVPASDLSIHMHTMQQRRFRSTWLCSPYQALICANHDYVAKEEIPIWKGNLSRRRSLPSHHLPSSSKTDLSSSWKMMMFKQSVVDMYCCHLSSHCWCLPLPFLWVSGVMFSFLGREALQAQIIFLVWKSARRTPCLVSELISVILRRRSLPFLHLCIVQKPKLENYVKKWAKYFWK